MMSSTGATFLDHIESLPPLPAVARRILAVTGSPEASASAVARALSQDPAVAARVLRVANSPFYGVSREITQISRAVVVLGSRAVRTFVVAICARRALMNLGQVTAEHSLLWTHATAAATAGELIARQTGFKSCEEAFVAGLLHDVGQIAMASFEPRAFRAVVSECRSEADRLARERQSFGFDHAEAGFRVLSNWNLPDSLCQAARRHHADLLEVHTDADRLSAMVLMANAMAHVAGFGLDVPSGNSARLAATARLLGLSESDQMRVLETLERRWAETREVWTSAGGDAPSTSPSPTGSRALWIASDSGAEGHMSRFLLERRGYEVERVRAADARPAATDHNLILVECDPAQRPAPERLAGALAQRGARRVLLLRDADEGEPVRARDPATGFCYIPRLFSAQDLEWAEQQLPR